MKKIIAILMVAVIAVGLSGCTKEGAYNPMKRISKIFVYEEGVGGLEQTWSWSKKTLDKITYDDGTSALLSYDSKNRLIKMTLAKNNLTTPDSPVAEYTYDGKYLSKIVIKEGNKVDTEVEVKHSNGDISELTTTMYDVELGELTNQTLAHLTTPLLADPIIRESVVNSTKLAARKMAESGSKATIVSTTKFTWASGNVTSMETNVQNMGLVATQNFTYDDKTNPFYNCYAYATNDDSGLSTAAFSINNVLVSTSNVSGMMFRTEYTYRYDDSDLPTEQHNITENIVTIYEYK